MEKRTGGDLPRLARLGYGSRRRRRRRDVRTPYRVTLTTNYDPIVEQALKLDVSHADRRKALDRMAHPLVWLARLLPAANRDRFVAEERGNLAGCERWWQRLGWLIGLAFGLPRLAWIMRREIRRRRT